MPKLTRHDEIAQIFCQDSNVVKNILYVQNIDTYFRYNEEHNYWMFLDDYETKNMMYQFLKTIPLDKGITVGMIQDIISLASFDVVHRREDDLSPYLSLKDSCINLETFNYVKPRRKNYSFQYLDFTRRDVELQEGKTPMFTEFINSSLIKEGTREPDKDLIRLVQEMFGYLLLSKNPKHVAFNLVGVGRNGKSVMIDIIRAMAGGDRFCTGLTLEQLSDKFNKSEILGKKLNLCSEDDSSYIRADVFKAVTSGDHITAMRKFLGTVTFKPRIKLVMSSNDYLRFNKIDEALMRRIIIIPFFRVFAEQEQIPHLSNKIIENELPGVLAWAIEGVKRLAEKNYIFTMPEAVKKQKNILKGIVSSPIHFFVEKFEPKTEEDGDFVPMQDIYYEYQIWCDTNGRKATSKIVFSKDIGKIKEVNKVNKWHGGKTTRGIYVKRKE